MKPHQTILRPVYEIAFSAYNLAVCDRDASIQSTTKSYHATNSMSFSLHEIAKLLKSIRNIDHSTLDVDAALAITQLLFYLLPALCNKFFSVRRLKTA